jgi:hypothetical protein
LIDNNIAAEGIDICRETARFRLGKSRSGTQDARSECPENYCSKTIFHLVTSSCSRRPFATFRSLSISDVLEGFTAMPKIWTTSALTLLFCTTTATAAPKITSHRYRTREAPPLAGIVLGLDTELIAQKMYGSGLRCTGEHSDSCLIWRLKPSGWFLSIDGFWIANDGAGETYYIDEVQISTDSFGENPSFIPTAYIKPQMCAVYGRIAIGQKGKSIFELLRSVGVSPTLQNGSIQWSGDESVSPRNSKVRYSSWNVDLGLNKYGRVNYIGEIADGDIIQK